MVQSFQYGTWKTMMLLIGQRIIIFLRLVFGRLIILPYDPRVNLRKVLWKVGLYSALRWNPYGIWSNGSTISIHLLKCSWDSVNVLMNCEWVQVGFLSTADIFRKFCFEILFFVISQQYTRFTILGSAREGNSTSFYGFKHIPWDKIWSFMVNIFYFEP